MFLVNEELECYMRIPRIKAFCEVFCSTKRCTWFPVLIM